MESFSRYLVEQRELRGLSPADVMRVTKLSPAAVEAIENDRFERLPGRAFVLGYLRSYANCVGLNPDEVILRYEEHAATVPPPEKSIRLSLKGAAGPTPIRFVYAGLVAALVLGVALFFLLR